MLGRVHGRERGLLRVGGGGLGAQVDAQGEDAVDQFGLGVADHGVVHVIELGLLGKDKPYPDTASAKLDKVKLTKEWKQYTFDLKGKDLTRIKTGFSCVWAAEGKAITFYLDDVRYQ